MRDNARGIYAVTVPLTTGGNQAEPIMSSCRLCGWSLGDAGVPAVSQSLDSAVAAAAAGTLTLTGFLSVAEILIEPAAAWPAGANQVTLTNVAGGTQTFDIEGGTENAVQVTFPDPLATSGTPVLSVPAIAGGPAYTMMANGLVSGGSPPSGNSVCNILDGAQVIGVSSPLAGVSDTSWLSDFGVLVTSGITVKVISGAVTGCLYVYDGTDILEGGLWTPTSTMNSP